MSFGRVLRALESSEVDAVDALAEVCMRLASMGYAGRWETTLSCDRRLLWDMRWLLPAARTLCVDSDGTTAVIRLEPSRGRAMQAILQRDTTGWVTDQAERLVEVGAGRSIALLPSYAVPGDMIAEDDFHSIFEFPPITAALAQPFASALDLLALHVPLYQRWVEDVLRGLVPCRCNLSRTRSSSWMHAPGIVLISTGSDPVTIAEMLIHESSHQYFHLLARLGPVDDGSDQQEYFSPAVGRPRRLSRILIGYHAFANVLLFYRTLLQTGFGANEICVVNEARISHDVERLSIPLRDNTALTPLGRDLVEPLMRQLA
jgi:HEXXH motif-containing protein